MTALDHRTRQEAEQATWPGTLASSLEAAAAHIRENGARDAALLGRGQPVNGNIIWPVTAGTEAERIARIDAFAAAAGAVADWHLPSGTYRAVVRFGPVALIAFTHAEADVERQTEIAERRMAEFRAALAERRAAA